MTEFYLHKVVVLYAFAALAGAFFVLLTQINLCGVAQDLAGVNVGCRQVVNQGSTVRMLVLW